MPEQEIPEHIKVYMDCLEKMTDWVVNRAKIGDVDISKLAYTFADNLIKRAKKTLS